MKKTLVLLIWSAWALFAQAQRADLVPFLVFLQPSNEVPAISDTSSATGIIWLHLIDDGKNILGLDRL